MRALPINGASRSAYHEAGHAVVLAALNRRFVLVAIEDGTRTMDVGDKRVQFFGGVFSSDEQGDAFRAQVAVGALDLGWLIAATAGFAAEFAFVRQFDRELTDPLVADLANLDVVVGSTLGAEALVGPFRMALVDAAKGEAARILIQKWSAVERFARALCERRALTFDEVKAIIG